LFLLICLFLYKINLMIIVEIKLPEKDAEMILKVISKLGGKVKLISLMFLNFRLPQKK